MNSPGLQIRQSSAQMLGAGTGQRKMPVVSKYIDTSTCIGCKACEVACQEWNDLPTVPTAQVGTYQTMPSLDANYWNLIKFREIEVDGNFNWLLRKDQCMHCDEPGCLEACPAPGAIVQYVNGIVDVDPERCIGCGICEHECPVKDDPAVYVTAQGETRDKGRSLLLSLVDDPRGAQEMISV